jgi:hypothetical protein
VKKTIQKKVEAMICHDKYCHAIGTPCKICTQALKEMEEEIKIKSKCCNAPVKVSTADEGTSCYVCTRCQKPCDILAKPFDGIVMGKAPIQKKEGKSYFDYSDKKKKEILRTAAIEGNKAQKALMDKVSQKEPEEYWFCKNCNTLGLVKDGFVHQHGCTWSGKRVSTAWAKKHINLLYLPDKEPEVFTLYDLRGAWASEEDKKTILIQLNKKLNKFLSQQRTQTIEEIKKLATEVRSENFLDVTSGDGYSIDDFNMGVDTFLVKIVKQFDSLK